MTNKLEKNVARIIQEGALPLTQERRDRLRRSFLNPPKEARWKGAWVVAASLLVCVGTLIGLILIPRGDVGPGTSQEEKRVQAWIDQLNSADIEDRDKAEAKLMELGEKARPLLIRASKSPRPEVAKRAVKILHRLDLRRRLEKITKDPKLRKKMEEWTTAHPGKAIAVTSVSIVEKGKRTPVPGLKMMLNYVPRVEHDHDTVDVHGAGSQPSDEDGHLYFVLPPGEYFQEGWGYSLGPEMRKIVGSCYFRTPWRKELVARDIVMLLPLEFVPAIPWKSPAPGARVKLEDDPIVRWEAYPGVTKYRMNLQKKDGEDSWIWLGATARFDRNQVKLSTLQKSSNQIFRVGDTLVFSLTGYDDAGNRISGSAENLELKVVGP